MSQPTTDTQGTSSISFKQASQEGLESNLRRYLAFLGVADGDFTELAAIGTQTTFTSGTRTINGVLALASHGGLLTTKSGAPPDGIYLIVNKATSAAGARYAPDKWHPGIKHISDRDIERRRAFYIDLDPHRASGTSATKSERSAAKKAAARVYNRLLLALDGPESLGVGSSGNGYHVVVALDCREKPEVAAMIARIVTTIWSQYTGERDYGHQVDVDRSVVKPGQLGPAFGTLKCKGTDYKDAPDEERRPHRRSFFWGPECPKRLSETELEDLAANLEAGQTSEQVEVSSSLKEGSLHTRGGGTSTGDTLLSTANAHPVLAVAEWLGIVKGGCITCPGCGEKGDVGKRDSVTILEESNRLKCSHNRCADKGLGGSRTPIELVIEARRLDRATKGVVPQAAREVCEHFGLHYDKGVRKKGQEPNKNKSVYREVDGRLLLGETELAQFTARITNEVVKDDGTKEARSFTLQGETCDGLKLTAIEVAAKDFADMKWVAPCWGARAKLAAGRSAWAHAAAGIQALSSPSTSHVYAHTGWREIDRRRVYLLPGGGISEDGIASVDCRPPGMDRYGGPRTPGAADALAALEHSLSILGVGPEAVTAPVLALAYLAPLASMLDGVPFVTWMVGRSGGYKSSLAALAQAHWGDFDFNNLPLNWGSTVNFLEVQISRSKDVLTTIDNFVPAQTGSDAQSLVSKAVRLIQNIGDGQDRGRLDSNAEERSRRRMLSAVLATAELLPPDNASTLGRCLVVEIENGALDLGRIRACRLGLDLLPLALGGYVRWLGGIDPTEVKRTFETMRQVVLNDWRHVTEGGHNRIGDIIARLKTAVALMLRYGASVGLKGASARAQQFDQAFATAALAQPRPASLTGADAWLDGLRTILQTHEAGLQTVAEADLEPDPADEGKRPVPLIGWIVGEQVLLNPAAAYRAVQRFMGNEWRYSQTELGRQLRTATQQLDTGDVVPVLSAGDGRNVAVKRSVGGQRQRVWALDRRVLGVLAGYDGPRAVLDADVLAALDQV